VENLLNVVFAIIFCGVVLLAAFGIPIALLLQEIKKKERSYFDSASGRWVFLPPKDSKPR
jgi:hypothetical protein